MTTTPTTGPDLLIGTTGDDTIDGLAGNDTINGGVGNDTLTGNDGDDTFIEDQFYESDVFDGGTGTDTLELRPLTSGLRLNTAFGLTSAHLLFSVTLNSVERLSFASSPTESVTAILPSVASGFTTLIGGSGRDSLAYFAGAAGAGVTTMPSLTLLNWGAAPTNGWDDAADTVALLSQAGSGQSATLNAAAGLNTLQILQGGNGNETLNGSANADYLVGGVGTDQLFGNAGNDSLAILNMPLQFAPNPATGAGSVFNGGDGIDLLTIGGYVNFQGTLTAMEGVNLLPAQPIGIDPLFGPYGRDTAVLEIDSTRLAMLPTNARFRGTGTVIVNLADNVGFNGTAFQIEAGSSVEFHVQAGVGNVSLIGSSTSDTLAFGVGTQSATGGAGADAFRIGTGTLTVTDFTVGTDKLDFSHTDAYIGSRVHDFASQGAGGAAITLNSGTEHVSMVLQGISLSSLSGDDLILGDGNFANNEIGTALADVIMGGELNDNMNGGDGDDRLYTGGGADTVFGGNGNDTIVVDGVNTFVPGQAPTGIHYDGGAGTDTLLLRYNEAALVSPTTGLLTSTIQLFTSAPGKLVGFETIAFDSLAGESVMGIANRDDLVASGVTSLVGGTGIDVLIMFETTPGSYTTLDLTLTDWGAEDTIVLSAPGSGSSALTAREGLAGRQILIAGNGDDTLTGTTAADTLMGGLGADLISGMGGADLIFGGGGNDVFRVSGQEALIFEAAAEGFDTVFSSSDFYLYQNIEQLVLETGAGNTFGVGNELANQLTGNEGQNLLIGGAGNDSINGEGETDALFGQAGADSINGGAGIDYLVGGDDDDALGGGNDADALYGEDGNDSLDGGYDFVTDILVGGNGNDVLYGSSGQGDYDLMDGGADNDIYYVDTGDDLTFEALNGGTDTVRANVAGTNNGVYLYANVENLILDGITRFGVGNELANTLTGNSAGNWLLGGAGNDTIWGAEGNDVLFGQGGNDTFVFESGTGGDVIGDFTQGQDKIEINGIYATFDQMKTHFVQVGTNGAIDLGAGDVIVIHNVTMANLTAADFVLL